MSDYLTVGEVYLIEQRLIELFCGAHTRSRPGRRRGRRFSPADRLLPPIEEEATALMESL